MIYFAVSMVLEIVFGILASIITMWFSRRREFYADAAGSTAKLVGREKMIATCTATPENQLRTAGRGRMMAFCINGRNKSFSELFYPTRRWIKAYWGTALRSGEFLN